MRKVNSLLKQVRTQVGRKRQGAKALHIHPKPRGLNLEQLEDRRLLAIDGSISGTVFEDLDGDGVQAAGEVGLPNWAVELQSMDRDGTLLAAYQDPSRWGSPRFGGASADSE